MTSATQDWLLANQRDLAAALDALREGIAAGTVTDVGAVRPAALERLCELFGLSAFERQIVLLAAGRELSSSFGQTLAQVNAGRPWPTFSLALALLPDAHWSALSPESPLRAWRLLELSGDGGLAERELRLEESILHWLTGIGSRDERLTPLLVPIAGEALLAPSHVKLARDVAAWIGEHAPAGIEIAGCDQSTRQALAFAIADALGRDAALLPASHVPAAPHDRAEIALRLRREARLHRMMFAIEAESSEAELLAAQALDARIPLLMLRAQPMAEPLHGTLQVSIEPPSSEELKVVWRRALGEGTVVADDDVDRVVSDFKLAPRAIAAVAAHMRGLASTSNGAAIGLWDTARTLVRRDLGELAHRVERKATWDDLVLSQRSRALLKDIVGQVRNRWRVYDRWGFAGKSSRGLGLATLFSGQSGVGKTMAAEVIANDLDLDLFQIDLSSVVSKYIGETEKNLRRLFDAAEGSGAILFFDEADALFGRRSEVKDSHDRYANIEVSYLLQRMESYRGLAILASNLKASLDHAFLRRLRFIVEFPFPDTADRAEIWRRVFPPATPLDGLDYERLARLHVPGGNIRNIALNAAFVAADSGEPVRMKHILRAAQAEYSKLERPLSDAEVAGWV